MASRIGGFRRKSRHKMAKSSRSKGKISLRKYFQSFDNGDKVFLHVEPAVQRGMYPLKYMGKVGTVHGKVGSCYKVGLKDMKKQKTFIIHPVHLTRVENQ